MEGNQLKEMIQSVIASVADRVRSLQNRNGSESAEEETDLDRLADLSRQVDEARREWLSAKAYFETVSDPELVDHAIHLVVATEKKYVYLLRQAKKTYSRVREA